MSESSDPRVFFAAERTLLAWLRTGLTIIGLGFIVSRFRLFLHVLDKTGPVHEHGWIGSAIGIGLVVLGAVVIAGAAGQYARFCRGLGPGERPHHYSTWFAFIVAVLAASAGAALAAYLAIT